MAAMLEMFSGKCPHCEDGIHYPTYETSIECRHCNVYVTSEACSSDVDAQPQPYQDVLCRALEKLVFKEKKSETLQNTSWSCQEEKESFINQAISPLLTYWGINKEKKPYKLTNLGNAMEYLNCYKILGKRAALLSPEDAQRMKTNSKKGSGYTDDILEKINKDAEVAVQVPVKGGGHGLFLSLSMALVGKEIFWHALQMNVFHEMKDKKQRYLDFLKDPDLQNDWDVVLNQCDPNSVNKTSGKEEVRLVYLFAAANMLRRPIVLLDAQGDRSKSGVFLPCFHPDKDRVRGALCLVWADKDRTRVEPLLAVKERGSIQIPAELIPPAWPAEGTDVKEYCDIKSTGALVIKGKPLPDSYVGELKSAMLSIFTQENGIGVNLLSDVYRCVYRPAGLVNVPPPVMIDTIKQAMDDVRLYRCLDCRTISIMPEAVLPGGRLYTHAKNMNGDIQKDKKYAYILLGYQCQYDEATDRLVALKKVCRVLDCPVCDKKRIRKVNLEGEPQLVNGDITRNGKHYWEGDEYDKDPKKIPIGLEWKGQVYPDTIYWFYDQKDPALNSTVEGIIDHLIQKHFPDETDTKLRQRVARIVKLRLSQQYDLDIPGIEKYKKPEIKPPASILPDPDQTSVMQVHSGDGPTSPSEPQGATAGVSGGTRSQDQAVRTEDEDNQPSSDDDDSLYVGNTEPIIEDTGSASPRDGGAVPKQKKLKVQHNDKTDIIDIPHQVTFAELQTILERKVGIPVSRQYLKHGFPPKFITVPYENLHLPYTELQNNDKLVVEDKPTGGSMPKETKPVARTPATQPKTPQGASANPQPVGGQSPPTGQNPTETATPARRQPSKDSPSLKVLLKLQKMIEEVDQSTGFTPAKLIQNVLENKETADAAAGGIIADLLKETDVDAVVEAVTLWRQGIAETKQSK